MAAKRKMEGLDGRPGYEVQYQEIEEVEREAVAQHLLRAWQILEEYDARTERYLAMLKEGMDAKEAACLAMKRP